VVIVRIHIQVERLAINKGFEGRVGPYFAVRARPKTPDSKKAKITQAVIKSKYFIFGTMYYAHQYFPHFVSDFSSPYADCTSVMLFVMSTAIHF
jgi:hypothetical protein